MKKFFIAILIGFLCIPLAEAAIRRIQPIYSFSRAQQVKQSRFVRSQWRYIPSSLQYRFSSDFNRADRLSWKENASLTSSESHETESPAFSGYGDFCNYQDTIIGEYLPSEEVKNRCCVCLDGWKCQYSVLSGGAEQLSCDPEWIPPNTTGEEIE